MKDLDKHSHLVQMYGLALSCCDGLAKPNLFEARHLGATQNQARMKMVIQQAIQNSNYLKNLSQGWE
ncbi:MAG: hypothetical protein ACOZAN_00540 [Patescibacteria group bacterium]